MKYPVTVHGWQPVILSRYTFDQLDQLRVMVMAEHENPRNEQGLYMEYGQPTIHIYDKRGRHKLDQLSWAVYHKQRRERRR